jgi:plasmid maintenance system antidote protein VapI
VAADTALRLAFYFGIAAEFWDQSLNIQAAYDLSAAVVVAAR